MEMVENSSVFFLIQMQTVQLCSNGIIQFLTVGGSSWHV